MEPGLTFINADMGPQLPDTLRVQGARIAGLGCSARAGDRVVDLEGDRLLPGLINAHDHLQLNSFTTPDYGRRYGNAGEWIADFNARPDLAYLFEICRRIPLEQRLLHGGVKNLLSGVTTVAHHDPLYPTLASADFPIGVLQGYGWSHSLEVDGNRKVRDACAGTPPQSPWIIHAAEGIDEVAAAEFDQLEALGCMKAHTVLVHGVGLDSARQARLAASGAALIWCPASNLRLFGVTAEVSSLAECGRVALGSDSRLTGSRDLLDELRVAASVTGFDETTLQSLVTGSSARLLGLGDRGVLKIGGRADLIVLPESSLLSKSTRSDLRMVMVGGSMRYGDACYAALLMPEEEQVEIQLDGCPKTVDIQLGALLSDRNCPESGVEIIHGVESAA
jgi:cytosine/adenosine deaminase-related metal-dependent hydrolase